MKNATTTKNRRLPLSILMMMAQHKIYTTLSTQINKIEGIKYMLRKVTVNVSQEMKDSLQYSTKKGQGYKKEEIYPNFLSDLRYFVIQPPSYHLRLHVRWPMYNKKKWRI